MPLSYVESLRALALVAVLALLAPLQALAAPSVSRFTPSAVNAPVDRVEIVFSEPMLPFGKTDAPAPFAVDCPFAGSGRWIDQRQWVYRFEQAVPSGIRCVFEASPDVRALAGEALTGNRRFIVQTGGPSISQSWPYDDSQIDEDQVFVLRVTGPVDDDSLPGRAWCQAEGFGERIPLKLLPVPPAAQLPRAIASQDRQFLRVLQCARRLPAAAGVRLVWDAGIATPSGMATLRRQVLSFKVRPLFQATLNCERENARAACMPLGALRLVFSAPVPVALAMAVRLETGPEIRPASQGPIPASKHVDSVHEIRFAPPFPEQTAFRIVLPAGFRDVDARPLANADAFPMRSVTAAFPPLAKFASAPFGIIESMVEPPVMPLTVRDLEPGFGLKGLAPDRPTLREVRVQSDAQILAWSARLQQFHESVVTEDVLREETGRKPLRRPKGAAMTLVPSRTVSLLADQPSAVSLRLPPARQPASGTGDAPQRMPFEVIGVPLPEPGFHVLELESMQLGEALLGRRAPMFVRTAALVTNLSVHFKLAREHAMVWVTTLDRGAPVPGAQVQVSDCHGKPVWSGRTGADGVALVDRPLGEAPSDCGAHRPGWFVSARAKDARGRDDVSFVWSGWNQGIEPWRFDPGHSAPDDVGARVHTVMDRTLLRAGETISMKHLIRVPQARGLTRPPDARMPTQVTITHVGSGQTYVSELAWKQSAAETVFRIPTRARLGLYQVSLRDAPPQGAGAGRPSNGLLRWGEAVSGTFRVEAFSLPVFDARLSLPAPPAIAPAQLPLQAQVAYLSGGPARDLPMAVSARLEAFTPRFDDYDEFSFSRSRESATDGRDSGWPRDGRLLLDRQPLTLDANGAGGATIGPLPAVSAPQTLAVEASYQDPAGEIQTVRTTKTLWPSSNVIGIRSSRWLLAGSEFPTEIVVLDTDGRPRAGAGVSVKALLRTTLSSRKRLVGGFYAYDHSTQVRQLGEVCAGRTDTNGRFECRVAPRMSDGETGNLILIAESADAQGRIASADASVWMNGRGELWFDADNHDRIELLPERKRYQPGDTARFQVRMPFRRATAWVTVEREGIVESHVVRLDGRNPTVELPVKANWGPGVTVSVLALRGRLREVPWYSIFVWGWRAPIDWFREWRESDRLVAPTPTVDLARPMHKLGVAEIAVGIDGHRLDVQVVPDRTSYPVRGSARVQVRVRLPDGRPAPAGTEFAFAAVDEALLALAPNESWRLLESMLSRSEWAVDTATAQMQVVGRRHFGRKAVPAGGDGGINPTRELFNTLLLWKPRVLVDGSGLASVDVPLNDALTGFRLVAIADSGPGLFGTGEATIRTTQDLQLQSGLPELVREGDALNGMLTVRNASMQAVRLSIEARATAISSERGSTVDLPSMQQRVELAPGEAGTVFIPVRVPERVSGLRWTLRAIDAGGRVLDALSVRQTVVPAVPSTVRQATLAQVDAPLSLALAPPVTALPGSARVRVALSASIADALDGVRAWFRQYPYICLEQQASVLVGLGDLEGWRALMAQLPPYLDDDGLARYFPVSDPASSQGSEVLTAYLLSLADEAGWQIPVAQRDIMLRGLARWAQGRIRRDAWSPERGQEARQLAVLEALARHGRATAAMVSALRIEVQRLPVSAVLDWIAVLERVDGIQQREQLLAAATAALRARLVSTGAQITLAQSEGTRLWWLMRSPDADMARVLLWAVRQPAWKDDAPRMLSGMLARTRQGVWDTTTANAWGSLALRRFAGRFEPERTGGQTQIALERPGVAADMQTRRWSADVPQPLTFELPAGESRLRIIHQGSGAPWASIQVLAAVPATAPQDAGLRLTRSVEAVQRSRPGVWSRGDVLRVRLTVQSSQPMAWVALTDPVPAGATVLGSGLGRDSRIADEDADGAPSGVQPLFVERRAGMVQAYYDMLPPGQHRFSYAVRLNQDGDFGLPPTRAEAMYAPEYFGELPNARIQVAR